MYGQHSMGSNSFSEFNARRTLLVVVWYISSQWYIAIW